MLRCGLGIFLTFVSIDPEDLERADVVLTTYDVVANEWAVRGGSADEKPAAKKAKAPVAPATPDEDSDSDGFGGRLKQRKEALLAAAKGSKPKKAVKPQDALFQVNFLRVVVDEVRHPVDLQEHGCQYFPRRKTLKAGRPSDHWRAPLLGANIVGFSVS
jgi:hypothetical protein